MTEIEIVREDAETGGRYVGRIAGCAGEAELVFSKAGAELLVAEHTEVPDSMRGTGTGALDIGPDDPSMRARSGDLRKVQPPVRGDAARQR